MVRGPVVAHQAAAVDGEHHRQPLQGHIVDDRVVRALQERRVDRHDGAQALEGHPGGGGHGDLLGDPDVQVAVRVRLRVADQTAALAHGGRDHEGAWVLRGQFENVADHFVVAELHALDDQTVADIEAGNQAAGKYGCNSSMVSLPSSKARPETTACTGMAARDARSWLSRTPPEAIQSISGQRRRASR